MVRPQVLPSILLASAGVAFTGLAALPTTSAFSISQKPGTEILAVGGPEMPSQVVEVTPALPAAAKVQAGATTQEAPAPQPTPKAETPLANAQVRASRSTARVQRAQFVRPAEGRLTSSYGPRWGRMHSGIDIGAAYGAPIRAVSTGVVTEAGYSGGYGRLVVIRHDDGTETYYAHQSRISVSVGEKVLAGETIGLIGSSGFSTGPHLHFEVRLANGSAINPRTWLRERGISY